eukprot:jgi/Mesvir1/5037/Mv02241-RA.2
MQANEQKLATEIVRDEFGPLVSSVYKVLASKYTCPLFQVIKECPKMQPGEVKNCLLVLIQHNCVQSFKTMAPAPKKASAAAAAQQQGPRTVNVYMALNARVLHRMRFPLYLHMAKDALGDTAEEVLEGLLEHGRLTVGQVVERAAARTQGGPATKDKVMRAFVSLVQQGFVERAPPHSPALPTPAELSGTEAPAPGTRQRANKALSRAQITQAAATATERAAAVASSTALIPAVDRFRLPSTMIKYADDGTGGGTAAMEVEAILASARPLSGAPTGGIVAGSNASAAANKDKDKDKEEDAGGKKRKAPGGDVTVQSNADVKGLEAAQRAVSQVDEREMLWRANYDEFLHRARIEEIKRFVRARYDPLSEAIVDVMMTANRRWLATDKEPPLISPDSVVELLTEKAAKRPKLDPLNDREAPSLAEVEAAMYTMCLGKEPVKAITRLTASHYGVSILFDTSTRWTRCLTQAHGGQGV